MCRVVEILTYLNIVYHLKTLKHCEIKMCNSHTQSRARSKLHSHHKNHSLEGMWYSKYFLTSLSRFHTVTEQILRPTRDIRKLSLPVHVSHCSLPPRSQKTLAELHPHTRRLFLARLLVR